MVVACGDGSIKLYDIGVAQGFPVMNFHEHKRETFAVYWNPVTKDSFVSSSWDGTIKIVSVIFTVCLRLGIKASASLTQNSGRRHGRTRSQRYR